MTEHLFGAANIIICVMVLVIMLMVGFSIKKYKSYYTPESAVALLFGILLGLVIKLIYGTHQELTFVRFQPEIFFFLLLPPIIFEAGYGLDKVRFFRNFWSIFAFAMLGTTISSFIVGFGTYAFAQAGLISFEGDDAYQSLLFGALLSATDPVATLAIMGSPELHCNSLLYTLVFGEAVLNDAVGIMLFNTFASLADPFGVDLGDWYAIPLVLLQFLVVAFGSMIFGFLIGLGGATIVRNTSLSDYPDRECTLLLIVAYASYAIAESLGMSGVMCLFFCGITCSQYMYPNMSKEAGHQSHNLLKTIAWLTETMTFVYIGLCLFTQEFSGWDFGAMGVALMLCLVGRVFNVFPISYFANKGRVQKITRNMQLVLWFSGLRGAIAFSLSLDLPNPFGTWDNDYVATTTLGVVCFTTLVFGSVTEPVLTLGGMKQDAAAVEAESKLVFLPSRMHKWYWKFEDVFLHPMYGGTAAGRGDIEMTDRLEDSMETSAAGSDSGHGGHDAHH